MQFLIFQTLLMFAVSSLTAASYGPPSSNQLFKGGQSPTAKPPAKDASTAQPGEGFHPLQKPSVPLMTKPFGMPGVIGLQDGKWIGTDYLGYLTNHIGLDVEILKPDAVQHSIDSYRLRDLAAKAFDKYNLSSISETLEGPPLPFLHLLITVYPVDRDKYIVIGNSRLFEQIQVVRKDFNPAGYWQGITWESQDITMALEADLNAKMENTITKLADAFASRYRQYNPGKSELPPTNSPISK